MKNHTKIYLKEAGYSTTDFIHCEVCESQAVDIHHIEARGMGGNPNGNKDKFENLMALCRRCHEEFGDIAELKEHLKKIHTLRFMQ